jgi:putative ABC transport system permease protein
MQVPLLSGRLFDDTDRVGTPSVVLVSRSLAERYFPGEDPIGKRVRTFFEGGVYATIVGVVDDTKDQSVAGGPRPQIYRTFWQRPQTWMGVVVRTNGRPADIVPSVRAIVKELDPDAVVAQAQPLSSVVAESIAQPRLLMLLLVAFGGLAVGLGALGIYGVMSYVVQQRSHEIGIRLALGARPSGIRRLVVGDALRLAAIGLAAGSLVAFWLTRLLETQLHEVSARDPLIFGTGLAALGMVAVLASWLPARRAARTEPTSLLRTA